MIEKRARTPSRTIQTSGESGFRNKKRDVVDCGRRMTTLNPVVLKVLVKSITSSRSDVVITAPIAKLAVCNGEHDKVKYVDQSKL